MSDVKKPREIKFKVLFGTDETFKTDITFLDDAVFTPGETFVMREVLPNSQILMNNDELRRQLDRTQRALGLAKNIIDSQNMRYALEQIEAIERGEK
jgi:hypothetical protein